MAAPDSPSSATASCSADTTHRHHRKCDRAVKLTDPIIKVIDAGVAGIYLGYLNGDPWLISNGIRNLQTATHWGTPQPSPPLHVIPISYLGGGRMICDGSFCGSAQAVGHRNQAVAACNRSLLCQVQHALSDLAALGNGSRRSGSGSPVPCAGCTAPGRGKYYPNDTPIYIPRELRIDNRPHGSLSSLSSWLNSGTDSVTWDEMQTVMDILYMRGWGQAAKDLEHWLGDYGTALPISPQQMMAALPTFKSDVRRQVSQGLSRGQSFDSGWLSDNVARQLITDSSPAVLNWYYALNGYQYRVYGTAQGNGSASVTVDVFKRYNWVTRLAERVVTAFVR